MSAGLHPTELAIQGLFVTSGPLTFVLLNKQSGIFRPWCRFVELIPRLDTPTLVLPLDHLDFPSQVPQFPRPLWPVIAVGNKIHEVTRHRFASVGLKQFTEPDMDALVAHHSPHQIGILSCEVILFASIALVTKGPEILIFGLPAPVSWDFVINMQLDFVFGGSPSTHLARTVIPPKDGLELGLEGKDRA